MHTLVLVCLFSSTDTCIYFMTVPWWFLLFLLCSIYGSEVIQLLYFSPSRLFWHKALALFFCFSVNVTGVLIEIVLNLHITMGNRVILMMVHEIWYCFYVVSSILSVYCVFQWRGLSLPWLILFLTLIFLNIAIMNGIVSLVLFLYKFLQYINTAGFCILISFPEITEFIIIVFSED